MAGLPEGVRGGQVRRLHRWDGCYRLPDPDTFSQPLVGRDTSLHNGYTARMDQLISATLQYSDRGRTAGDFKDLGGQRGLARSRLCAEEGYVVSTTEVSGSQYLSDATGIWRLWELNWI